MGPLILPTGGSVYVDANAIIYSVERVEPYRSLLDPMWEEARGGRFTLASSELIVLETLIKPLREGNAHLKMLFRSIFAAAEMELVPATLAVWEDAARIRAETGLATPDALHAATALRTGCTLFITNDTDFHRVQGLPTVILDDMRSSLLASCARFSLQNSSTLSLSPKEHLTCALNYVHRDLESNGIGKELAEQLDFRTTVPSRLVPETADTLIQSPGRMSGGCI